MRCFNPSARGSEKSFSGRCPTILALMLLLLMGLGAVSASKAQNLISNGNFSDGVNPANSLTTFEVPPGFFSYQFDQSNVPNWSTTATDGRIEIWESGHLGVPAQDGAHFGEVNATQAGAQLFQDITVQPGDTVEYSVWHRGRNGVDVANIQLGPPGSLTIQQVMTTGNTAWVNYTGQYVVPAGVTTLRIAFASVSTSSPAPAAGNFIDNASITVLPAPSLSITKEADDDTLREAGHTIVYTYTLTNTGNVVINNVSVSDVHNGSGPAPVPRNEAIANDNPPLGDSTDATGDDGVWSSLGPGDVITFTGNYTVTQADVDTLQ